VARRRVSPLLFSTFFRVFLLPILYYMCLGYFRGQIYIWLDYFQPLYLLKPLFLPDLSFGAYSRMIGTLTSSYN
jgi:hypothetical protein